LFLGKSTKTAATRATLFDSNMHKIVRRLGLRPRPHWGSLQRSPNLGGLRLKGGEERGGERKGREGERRSGERKRWEGRRGREFVFCSRKKKK